MKILKAVIDNFGSYKHLEFEFSQSNLALIYGPTGAGKSTLQDIVPWILFGETSKGGKADDIKSWISDTGLTQGVVTIQLSVGTIEVTRIRGRSDQNDLFWTEPDGQVKRGKDITETQKFLGERLGISYDTFIASAVFNEFSNSGNFFTAKGKDRRALFEGIADLSLPTRLAERSLEEKRLLKKDIIKVDNDISRISGKLDGLERSKISAQSHYEHFEEEKSLKIKNLLKERDRHDIMTKNHLTDLETHIKKLEGMISNHKVIECASCGNITGDKELTRHSKDLDRVKWQFDQLFKEINPYDEKLKDAKAAKNLYAKQLEELDKDIMRGVRDKTDLGKQLDSLNNKLSLLDILSDVNDQFRVELLKNAIADVEYRTNKYLQDFFDSELRIIFTLKDGDSLDTTIYKNGYECNYKQLSKGQRQLLKLSFSVSIMKSTQDKIGVHFDTLFFDEALDGLDTELKLKAFRLFEELSLNHTNVLVIDHSEELRQLFSTKFQVTMEEDCSIIKQYYGNES